MGKKHQEATRVRVFRVPSYSIIFNNLIYLNGVKSPANVSFSIATAGLCCHTSQILTIWPHYGINSDSKRWSDVRGCPQVHLLSRAHPSSSFATDLPVPSHPERSHGFNSKDKDVKIKRIKKISQLQGLWSSCIVHEVMNTSLEAPDIQHMNISCNGSLQHSNINDHQGS